MNDSTAWWKHGLIYQIYPRSFQDSNGDGIGDIPGIIHRIDYLADLGIDAVWLSPVNRSPMLDYGYDISDYRDIDPIFGTLENFDLLIKEFHDRGIRIIMDLALNHTSHHHQWFIQSSSSRENPMRDWYLWHDGIKGKQPNNWRSAFFESSWHWHESTRQYYLHSFLEEQPDVNWHNKELRRAMHDILRFWLDRGVDGFRLDVVNWFVKDAKFRNDPLLAFIPDTSKERFSRNRPETHQIIRELRGVTDQYRGRMLVGEVFSYPPGDPVLSASYLGSAGDELHLAFDFSLLYRSWNARDYYKCIKKWYGSIPPEGWPCHVLSNHDQPRSYNRSGNGVHDDKRARVAAVLLLTLRGTPFLYYGEEIGMKNILIPRNRIVDPAGKKFWPLYVGRDCARTPMQWTPDDNAGFTDGVPWLPLDHNYRNANVKDQDKDSYSLLNFYKKLIGIRKQSPTLTMGAWEPAEKGKNGVVSYFRKHRDQCLFITLNFTGESRRQSVKCRGQWKVLFSTHRSTNEHFIDIHFTLYPYEASVIERIGSL